MRRAIGLDLTVRETRTARHHRRTPGMRKRTLTTQNIGARRTLKDEEWCKRFLVRHIVFVPVVTLMAICTAWIYSYKTGDDATEVTEPTTRLLPRSLPATLESHHNYMPAPKFKAQESHGHDDAESSEIAVANASNSEASKWHTFIRTSEYSTKYPPGRIVSDEWIKSNTPHFDEPGERGFFKRPPEDKRFWLFSPQKRARFLPRLHRMLMRNPFVPLLIRLIVLAFCTAALSLGGAIFQESERLNPPSKPGNSPAGVNEDYVCNQQPSTYMAFIVDAAAVIYLCYITWDEYTSKPLGLRSSKAKMRLLFLDLLFIVFSAANLSLAYSTLTDRQWACYPQAGPGNLNNNNVQAARSVCIKNDRLCARQKALCGVLTIAEIAWLITYSISTLR